MTPNQALMQRRLAPRMRVDAAPAEKPTSPSRANSQIKKRKQTS